MVDRREASLGRVGERGHQRAKNSRVAVSLERLGGTCDLLHDLLEFLLHALHRKATQVRRALPDRLPGAGLDGKAEAAGESQRAQGAEAVLAHAFARLADAAHDALLQIPAPVERVAHLETLGVHRDRVHGEVAARQVLLERRTVAHDGMATVGLDVVTEGGDFVQHAVAVEHADGAELDADGDRAAKELLHLLGQRGSGDVPVEGLNAE